MKLTIGWSLHSSLHIPTVLLLHGVAQGKTVHPLKKSSKGGIDKELKQIEGGLQSVSQIFTSLAC